MKLTKKQINDILSMAQQYAEDHASVIAKQFDNYGNMVNYDDLYNLEQESYEILVNFLKSI